MPLTALIISDRDNNRKYVQVITQPDVEKGGLLVIIQTMDSEFEFKEGADIGTDPRDSEEEYHTELRKLAAEKEQLVTSHSTNPEWNPEGYVKNLNQWEPVV